MKVLGIDYGTKRVGIALSDDSGSVAFPHDVLENNKQLVENIHVLCEKESVERIVLGESRDFKGEKNAIMASLENFKEGLEKVVSVDVVLEQEFLTTDAARRAGTKENVDAHAAALILQRYLDKQT